MYKSMIITDIGGEEVEHIFCNLHNNSVQSFPNVDSNDGPERSAYLQWLAEGNEPEIIDLSNDII